MLTYLFITKSLGSIHVGQMAVMIFQLIIRSFHRQPNEPNGCVMSIDLPWMSEPSCSISKLYELGSVHHYFLVVWRMATYTYYACMVSIGVWNCAICK